MDNLGGMIIWCLCIFGCASVITGLGVHALRSKKPVAFWSGSVVKCEEITDIAAYNRANGVMWLVYSATFWISGLLGMWAPMAGAIVQSLACTVGLAGLIIAYKRIYRKYSV